MHSTFPYYGYICTLVRILCITDNNIHALHKPQGYHDNLVYM